MKNFYSNWFIVYQLKHRLHFFINIGSTHTHSKIDSFYLRSRETNKKLNIKGYKGYSKV